MCLPLREPSAATPVAAVKVAPGRAGRIGQRLVRAQPRDESSLQHFATAALMPPGGSDAPGGSPQPRGVAGLLKMVIRRQGVRQPFVLRYDEGEAIGKRPILTLRILYYGIPWSMGRPLVDDVTGYRVQILGGCVVTQPFSAEGQAYNEAMRAWHAKNKPTTGPK